MPAIQYIRKLSNPQRKRKSSTRRKRSNPLRVVTLGAANPRKRRNKTVARKRTRRRRRTTTATPRRRRRRNTYRAPARRRATRRTARRNPSRAVVRRRRRRRNPTDMKEALPLGLGGLVGVAATKMFVASLPPNLIGNNISRIVASGLTAMLVGWGGEKVLQGAGGRTFAHGMFFGGIMQTMSVALNAFLPQLGSQIGLSGRRYGGGMGDLIGGASYPVPQNPLIGAGRSAPPVPMSGVRRSYGNAY